MRRNIIRQLRGVAIIMDSEPVFEDGVAIIPEEKPFVIPQHSVESHDVSLDLCGVDVTREKKEDVRSLVASVSQVSTNIGSRTGPSSLSNRSYEIGSANDDGTSFRRAASTSPYTTSAAAVIPDDVESDVLPTSMKRNILLANSSSNNDDGSERKTSLTVAEPDAVLLMEHMEKKNDDSTIQMI